MIKSIIDLKTLSKQEHDELLPEGLIHLSYRGSIAHGTYVPQEDPNSIDDKDIMGIYIAPLRYYFGLNRRLSSTWDLHISDVHESFIREWDSVHYELTKFIYLLLKGNPNVMSILWPTDKSVLGTTSIFQELIKNRDIFVTKKVYHSFTGYAHGQLHRMEHLAFNGYMGAKRKALVEKHGHDTKNASHLIRLLKMGIEFLMEGKMYVERTDSQYLIDIKRGKYSLEKIKEEADRLFKLAEEAYVRSPLPPEPDSKRADELCTHLINKYYTVK